MSKSQELTDNQELIVSLSKEIEDLRRQLDEADKEVIQLKAKNLHLRMLGTQQEHALVARLQARLRKYESDNK